MIVYAESNFILELARQQEDADPCEQILRMAEAGTIQLVLPAFAVCEPFSTLARYGSDRARFVEQMQREVRELSRLQPHKSLASLLHPLAQTLLSIEKNEMNALEATVQRILEAGRQIDLTPQIFTQACQIERSLGLTPQDAIVYASVLADLQVQPIDRPKVFSSRNPKDFDDPAIVSELRSRNYRYIARFSDTHSYVRNSTARA